MLAFDAPTREACTLARGRTNTPLQALVLLNDVQFVEAARALAEVASREHPALADQLANAFLRLTARLPDAGELQLLTEIYHDQRQRFASGEQDAVRYLAIGEAAADATIQTNELAALAATCQAMMNLDATIYER